MGGVPYLSAFSHIYDVIIVTPEISKFIIEPAVIHCKKRIATAKPVTTARCIYYILVEVIHESKVEKKSIPLKICNTAISN